MQVERLGQTDQRPVVILTRPVGRNAALAQALTAHGMAYLELPALVLEATSDVPPDPQGFDLVLFVSGFAVRCYVHAHHDTAWPRDVWAAGVGVGTRQAMRDSECIPETAIICPAADTQQDSEALWQTLNAVQVRPRRVLIVRGNTGRNWLAEQWRAAGVQVQEFIAYHRRAAHWSSKVQDQLRQAAQHPVCILLVSSRESADAIAQNLQGLGLSHLWGHCRVVAVHPRIADYLRQWQVGVQNHYPITVTQPDTQSLVRAMLTLATKPA